MARVIILICGQLRKKDAYEAISELDKAKDLLGTSIRFGLLPPPPIDRFGLVLWYYCPKSKLILNQNPK